MVLFGKENENFEGLNSIYNIFREKRKLTMFAKNVQRETIKTRQGKRLAKLVKMVISLLKDLQSALPAAW